MSMKYIPILWILAGAVAIGAPNKSEVAESYYERGMTVYSVDPEASLGLLQKAAKLGHVNSMVRLAYCYQTGTGARPSPKSALQWYTRAAEAGHIGALYEIGSIHEQGISRNPPDYEKAITWYEKGVAGNSLKSCAGLARIYASCPDAAYHDGPKAVKYATVLVSKDPRDPEGYDLLAAACARNLDFLNARKAAAAAVELSSLEAAADRRSRKSAYEQGKPYPKMASDEWMLKAAEADNTWAMLHLADEYTDILSKRYNPVNARHWFEKAMENGSNEALVQLGHMCFNGQGGPVDLDKAFWCFSKAAEAEVPEAYAPLARMYVGGKGTRIDLDEAMKWYTMSKQAGFRQGEAALSALRNLSKDAEERSPEQLVQNAKRIIADNSPGKDGKPPTFSQKTARVYAHFWLAAEQGDTDAMKELADMYFYGRHYFVREGTPDKRSGGINNNYIQAMYWYEQLSQKGIDLPEKAACENLYLEQLIEKRARQEKAERERTKKNTDS